MNVENEILLDLKRRQRTGLDEAVYCAGKSVDHILEILRQVDEQGARILLTRLEQAQFDELPEPFRQRLDFDPLSATAFFPDRHSEVGLDRVAVVAAGTSDAAVLAERRAAYKPSDRSGKGHMVKAGYAQKYIASVGPASHGAVTHSGNLHWPQEGE